MKIILNYDPSTGQIRDNYRTLIACWAGLVDHKQEDIKEDDTILKLVSLGVTADDLIRLKTNGII